MSPPILRKVYIMKIDPKTGEKITGEDAKKVTEENKKKK